MMINGIAPGIINLLHRMVICLLALVPLLSGTDLLTGATPGIIGCVSVASWGL